MSNRSTACGSGGPGPKKKKVEDSSCDSHLIHHTLPPRIPRQIQGIDCNQPAPLGRWTCGSCG